MTGRLILIVLLGLAACSAQQPANVKPEECPKPAEEAPVDGGLGGTGITPEGCTEE